MNDNSRKSITNIINHLKLKTASDFDSCSTYYVFHCHSQVAPIHLWENVT